MKIFFLYSILTAFLCSCSGHVPPSQQSISLIGPFSYCELLSMPSRPYPANEPKPYLGIYLATKTVEQSVQPCKEGVFILVAGVMNGTPAAKAGLKEGDIILSVNGNTVCSDQEHAMPSFKRMIEQQKVGTPAALEIVRNGRKLALAAVLEEQPFHEQQEAKHPELEKCYGQTSKLENALRTNDDLFRFNAILDDLYQRSNLAHNPGSALEKKVYPLQMKEVTYLMRHPLATGEVAKELSQRMTAPLEGPHWRIGDVMQRAAAVLDIDFVPAEGPNEITFDALLRAMGETKKRIEEALADLTPEERVLLRNKALNPVDDDQWNTVLEISLKVDRTKLLNAFSPLLSFLTRDNLSLLREDVERRFGGNKGPVLYEAMTPLGKVIVGGKGPNVYTEDAALILDLGGDDLYLNNAGGTRPGMPVSLVIDWGGDDRYLSKENFTQGAGVLGGGFLLDLGGNDTFTSLDGSQGAGFWGMGTLYHGDGRGVFSARKFSQGTGQMGLGLLMNRKGDDRYLCSFGGQGLGQFGGAGILIDEEGNDFYELGGLEPDFRDKEKATQSFGQGFGLGERSEKEKNGVPGGLGMLIDEEGDDTYIADYFAQGASYYYGLGILDDRAGDDQYLSGRYAQGAGIHSSIGALIDRDGHDFYYSSVGVAQGMGHDYGVGYLEDDRGDDRYQGGNLVQGAATNGGLGIFMDLQGRDQRAYTSEGQAFAQQENGMGIMITTGRTVDALDLKIGTKKEHRKAL